MILTSLLLAGCCLALPTPESEETDGDVSRKILGSSVVTSVSVIMDVGNGSQTFFSDAVGKPMTKPSAATQLASPINLLNPDRYEFYTFDDSGDLVKRLMTLDEIQGIIASGDGEATNYNSQSLTGDEPEKRVDDVVSNVQNVLKEEMEAHKTSNAKPPFNTPDVTSTWNMILPAIFGGENGVPEQQNSATAETIMIEPTTVLPELNNTNVRTAISESTKQTTNSIAMTNPDVTTEIASNENSQTETSSEEIDTPIITVEINSNDTMLHDEAPADSKTESSFITESNSASNFKDTQSTLSSSETEAFTSRPVIIISTPSPFTNKIETILPSTTPSLSSTSSVASTTLSSTSPSTMLPSSTTTSPLATSSEKSPATILSTLPPNTTPEGHLSTFFLVEDSKNRPETTTTSYSTPAPFTLTKLTTIKDNIEQKAETTTNIQPSTLMETSASAEIYSKRTISPITEVFSTTDIPQENNKEYLIIDSSGNVQKQSSTQRTTVLNTKPYTSTVKVSSTDHTTTEELTTKLYSEAPTIDDVNDDINLRFSTPAKTDEQSTTVMAITSLNNEKTQSTAYPSTEYQEISQFTQLPEITTEKIDDTQKQSVTELFNQFMQTTSVYALPQSTTDTVEKAPTTEQVNLTTLSKISDMVPNSTLKPENDSLATAEPSLVSSIEQLISQAIGSPEQSIESIKDGQTINQVIHNTNSKPMSEVQIETATAASALIGAPIIEHSVNESVADDKVNQAVDSLISQVIYHQPIQTTERFTATTDNIKEYTEQTTFINNNASNAITDTKTDNDINRYEEIDLEDIDVSTISNFESKTAQPILILKNETYSSFTTEIPEKSTSNENQLIEQTTSAEAISSTKLYQDEIAHQTTLNLEVYGMTEKIIPHNTPTKDQESSSFLPEIGINLESNKENITDEAVSTSTEIFSSNNEILKGEASEYNQKESASQTIVSTTSEDFSTSTETFTTSRSNEITESETTEVSQENSSEPFIIVASSSEYPDYASTEIIDVFTKNIAYDSTTSLELNDITETSADSTTTTNLLPQNYSDIVNSTKQNNIESYQTTEINLITESEPSTTRENSVIRFDTTQINIANETTDITTEKYSIPDDDSTEKTNFSTTQQLNTMSVTQQTTISTTLEPFTTNHEPIISNTQQSLTISTSEQLLDATTTQQSFAASTTQQSFTASTTQQSFASSITQQPNTSLLDQTPSTTLPTQQETVVASSTSTPIALSPITPTFINLPTVTITPKIDKPAELKLIQNITSSTTIKPDMTWTLVSTVVPHKTLNEDTKTQAPHRQEPTAVDLVPKPLQGFGLEDSTSTLDTDVFQFTELCNELAFSFWSSVTNGISFARSVIVSPFAATSMLAMVFLGARGSTSGEMNDILKLDDMVTFNPHSIFKNVIESIEVSKKSGVAVSVFVKELYSDKNKGKLLSFYKERVKQFYDGHVEEANFKEINDVIRRRTNLLVKRQTWGKIPEYLKDNNLFARPPLAAVSANIFQTDCSEASTEGRDGEIHFVVLPSIRQRKLVPIPAVVWRSGFLAGYDPGLDATAVAVGTKDQTISTIFVIPGQQGISAPGDGLMRLEARLIESAFRQGAWSRLLRSLIPRPGLEVQIPRFSHKSIINATMALQRMGLKDLFNSNTADLKGLNGVAHELYLSDIVQVNTFATCGEGRIDDTHHSEVYPATTNRSFRRIRKIQHYHTGKPFENSDLEEPRDYQRAFHDPLYDPSFLSLPLQLRPRQARLPEAPRLRFDRPFLYFVRHNPTGLILHMGRFNPRLLP